jgi:hypothetical protein
MTGCSFTDFDILIQGETPPHAVTVTYQGDHEVGTLTASMADLAWRAAHETLNHSLTLADGAGIEKVGVQLWHALFQGRIRDLWVMARTDWQRGHVEGIRLRLDIQPVPVAALPWEALVEPDAKIVFAAHPDFTLVRVATLAGRLGPKRHQRVVPPVRILIAAPEDPYGQIDADAEIKGIYDALGDRSERIVQIDHCRGQLSVTQLSDLLLKFKPTILHFIGHGKPDGLLMWQRDRPWIVAASSLGAMMARARSVKLAFLNACLAAQPAGPHPFTGVASQMFQAGLPAVIAMQYRIHDSAAIDFAHFLYDELICGPCPGLVDIAVNRARNSLYIGNSGDFSFGTPLLWLNSPDGRIFNVIAEAEKTGIEEAVIPAQPEVLLDLVEEQAWLDAIVATTQVELLPPGYAFLGTKWHNLVDELRRLLVQIEVLAQAPDLTQYGEKVADYRRFKASLLRIKRLIEEAATST